MGSVQTSSHKLPGFYPGTVNPLLWWTTPNLQVVATSLISAGLETSLSMMLRVGIMRTYPVSAQKW